MTKNRPSYTLKTKTTVVTEVRKGAPVAVVAAHWDILERTIRKWLKKQAMLQSLDSCSPGTKPRLPAEAESHLFEWVIGRQLVGHPVDCSVILKKANEISLHVTGTSLTSGWYQRYASRHPLLTTHVVQAMPLKQNCVVPEDLTVLFNTLAKLIIELRLDSSRIFNMDETAFQTRKKSKKVVALRGSSNLWCLDLSVNFHLSIVACGSAAGFAVPPTFILPGKTVQWDILGDCSIPDAADTTSQSGLINTHLFQEWLKYFAASVPASVKRQLLLVLDGCVSHYSTDVIDMAARLDMLLVLLPPNVTHLLQPLDVAVFGTFKMKLWSLIKELTEEDDDGCYSIDKPTSINLASMAWRTSKIGRNVKVGFRTSGIFPLSLVNMNVRLQNYNRNGVPKHIHVASWFQIKPTVEADVLTLRTPPKKTTNRKRAQVTGRLLTNNLLQAAANAQAPKRTKTPKRLVNPNRLPLTAGRVVKSEEAAADVVDIVAVADL